MNRILKPFKRGGAILVTLICSSAFAHHPNEGTLTLPTLIENAYKSNLELQEAQKQLESISASRRKTVSPFLPQVSVEGGYQSLQLDGERTRGSLVYGLATLNLYRGGKDFSQRESQTREEQFQKLMLTKTQARIERMVSKKYYELLYLLEGITLKEQAIEANGNQMALARRKKASGFTSDADVLEFELREATLRSDVNFLKREETVRERELARLIGLDLDQALRVAGHLERSHFSKQSNELLQLAQLENESLKESEKDFALSELDYKAAFGDYLPRVDIEGKYGRLANEERVYTRNDNYSLGLKVSIPIFSGLDTVYARKSRASAMARNEIALTRVRQEIQVQLENGLSKLKSVEERLDLEEQNLDRSKRYYEITLAEYKRGVKNSPDVAGAAERFFDSRLRNLEYRKDYFLTLLEVAEVVGLPGAEMIGR